jgi:hypothetical protein
MSMLLFSNGGNHHVLRQYRSVRLAHLLPSRLGHTGQTGKRTAQRMILTVEPRHLGEKFELGAVGLSLEPDELATRDLSTSHKSLVALMRLLGPSVLRLGGSSLDYSWWNNGNEQPPRWATSEVIHASAVTPADLTSLRELLAATGWRVILGVDLGHFEPTRAASEARVAEHILGSRLLGFEVGNEPDNYGDNPDNYGTQVINLRASSYNVYNYLEELGAYSTAMRAAVPEIHLYGPDLQPSPWLPLIASDKSSSLAVITAHYYPTKYNIPKGLCKGTPIPTAFDLLSPQVRQQENAMLQTLVSAGELAHRETRISETNTTASCDTYGGPDTSPVFASALWSLDWALRTASAGVAGINFHGYFGQCAPNVFSPVCAPSSAAEALGQVIARPEYYGLLAARQLEGGRFVPVNVSGQNASDDFTAYATVHPRHVITLAIDNFATVGLTLFLRKLPDYDKAIGEPLIAPSVTATNGVTFGHAAFSVAGVLRPTGTTISRRGGLFRLELAPTSATVITLHQ